MKIKFLSLAIVLFLNVSLVQAKASEGGDKLNPVDSLRIAEIDRYWAELAKTVREGNFEGYSSGYHEDAVVVLGSMKSVPIAHALKNWKQGFVDTKAGKLKSDLQFRFSQRLGDATTAFETGMFCFSTTDANGLVNNYYANFDALLVKKDGAWKFVMENQKSNATKEEWEAMQ